MNTPLTPIRHLVACLAAVLVLAPACERSSPSGGPAADVEPADRVDSPDAGGSSEQGPEPDAPGAAATPTPLRPELVPMFTLIRRHATGAARAQLEAHLAQHPNDGQASFLLGLAYHREHRYALARPRYEHAIEWAPGYHASYYFYGWCLYYLGEGELARDAFEEHLRFQPDEGDSHFAIGLIDLEEDRLDEAEIRFRRSIELQAGRTNRREELSKAHTRLADIATRRGEHAEARDLLKTATMLDADNYGAFYKLFRAHTMLGETAEADQAHAAFIAARRKANPGTSFPE